LLVLHALHGEEVSKEDDDDDEGVLYAWKLGLLKGQHRCVERTVSLSWRERER